MNLKLIYNFTYRLTGNIRIAETLIRETVSSSPETLDNEQALLKLVWRRFLFCYGNVSFTAKEELQQFLLELAPEIRAVLILRDILGLSVSQISAITGSPEDEILPLLAAGRRNLSRKKKPARITA
jgi:DNA-directed RNA polymerase specialized sigma24 family protein